MFVCFFFFFKQKTAYERRISDWSSDVCSSDLPFGIVVIADRLSVLMLVLTSVLGFTAMLYALARWDRSGPRFHALFLLLLMGVNGAFLTGDIFNLFVFFEVLLAASYRSEARRVGKECVGTCRSRCSPSP